MSTAALAAAPAPPPADCLPPCAYGWHADSGNAIVHANPDFDAGQVQAAELANADAQRLQASAQAARDLPEAKQAADLAGQLRAARDEQGKNEAKAAEAQSAARAALLAGENPEKHEDRAATMARRAETFAGRAAELERLLAPARQRADKAQRAALDRAWRQLLAEHDLRRGERLDELAEALRPLLARLLAVDTAQAGLYHPTNGGPPAWAVGLLQEP